MKRQSFATGAALLALAIALGKIFSAIFKIPLDRFFLHAEGMAVFNSVYNVYMLFFAVATAGIPMAISSLIASAKDKDEENTILSTSLVFTQVFLISCCVVIFLFSDTIAAVTAIPQASFSFKVMAPALIFCGITASFRGLFQGKRMMTPSALSQVLDSFGRLLLGFFLVCLFSASPIGISSACAMAGVPFGAFLSALCLTIAYFKSNGKIKLCFSPSVLKSILFLAMPITLTGSLHQIFNIVDTLSVVPTLSLFTQGARAAFGSLSRSAMLYALPVSIAGAVSSSILPAVSENLKKKNFSLVTCDSTLAIRLAITVSAPCVAGFMAISQNIFSLLYDEAANHLTLVFIAPSAVFLSVGTTLSCILQGMSKTKYTVFSAVAAICCKALLNIVLMFLMGVNGAALSTSVSYFIFAGLLFLFVLKLTPIRFSFRDILLKPLVSASVCFVTAFFSSHYLSAPFSMLLAALLYIPSVFLTGLISKAELKQIFQG